MTRSGNVTFDEFSQIIREDQKADLINGVIYMPSPANLEVNELVGWLYRLMCDLVDELRSGKVFMERVACKLSEEDSPEPDIFFIRKDQLHRCLFGRVDGPPDLAMEIVSPDSVERDYEAKFRLYEKHGVAEYWIIDEHEQRISAHYLDMRGKYPPIRMRKGELHSRALPGFWLKPEWLWQSPRPLKAEVLKEIFDRAK